MSVLLKGKQINQPLSITGSFTGSFTGDGSGLTNLPTQSFNTGSLVTTSSFNSYTGSSLSQFAGTSSFSQTASYLNTLNQDLTLNGNVTINGTASISFLNVTIESASVIYSSGSNQLGDNTDDTQTLIGTVIVSGSQQITGSLNAPNITGSLYGTSSWAINTVTSSTTTKIQVGIPDADTYYNIILVRNTGSSVDLVVDNEGDFKYQPSQNLLVVPFISASNGITGSLYGTASWATSASIAINAQTASFLPTGTYNITSSWAVSASQAVSASWAPFVPTPPGGSDTQIQFNSGSVFSGSSAFTFNYASQSL